MTELLKVKKAAFKCSPECGVDPKIIESRKKFRLKELLRNIFQSPANGVQVNMEESGKRLGINLLKITIHSSII